VGTVAKKNPVIQKARQEAYNLGFINGQEIGKKLATEYFAHRFNGLDQIKGIGPKTFELVVKHFGIEYFEVKE
jgi:hypothetical protein